MSLGSLNFSTAEIFLVLLDVSFDAAELLEQLVVLQNLKVLDMEVSLVVTLEALVGLARVDTLEDAELAEVLEADLHSADGI